MADASPGRAGTLGLGYRQRRDWSRPSVNSKYILLGFLSSGTYGRVYKARVRHHTAAQGPVSYPAGGAAGAGGAGAGGNVNSPANPVTPFAAAAAASFTPGRLRHSHHHHLGLHAPDTAPGTPGAGISDEELELVAIKKFKPDKEGDVLTYTGISQSACREIMINREISHENVTRLREVMLEDKSIYLIFEYAEHDFLQIIHHHSSSRTTIPIPTLKSLLWQLFNGVAYLHDNWIVHRDLKPANILVNSRGQCKIGDLGLARVYQDPLQSLYSSDKIVVTVWYRAPELLLGARHYTPSIDIWSIGCIIGELVGLRPMFKGEEAKIEVGGGLGKKGGVPFQRDQMTRVVEVLGTVDKKDWPGVVNMPEYQALTRLPDYPNTLYKWFTQRLTRGVPPQRAFDMLARLLAYDPHQRLTAREALTHSWWTEEPMPHPNAFTGLPEGVAYPNRRVTHDESEWQRLSNAPVGGGAPAPQKGAGSSFSSIGHSAAAAAAVAQQQSRVQPRAAKRARVD